MSKRDNGEKEELPKEATPKWYLIGIGGCGSNIVDDVLLRREKLEKDHSYSEIFRIGIFDWWIFNTNISDLKVMGTIRRMGFESDAEIADNYIIAPKKHKWVGAGGSPEQSKRWLEYDCSKKSVGEGSSAIEEFAGFDCRLDYVLESLGKGKWRRPQGILIIHGVGKGTGCGATPVLIEHLKRKDPASAIFALTIFPFKEELEYSGWYAFDSLYGLTNTCKHADALFLVGNSQLEVVVGQPVPLKYATLVDRANNVPEQREAANFYRQRINPPILDFLETLTVPSMGTYPGLTVDIADIQNFLAYHSIGKRHGIIVPLYYETGTVDVETEVLIENALGFSGQLIRCKPETAAGAYIILVGNLPRFKQFKDIFKTPQLLSKRIEEIAKHSKKEKGFGTKMDIRVGFAVTNENRMRMLILLANPQILDLLRVHKKASEWVNEKRTGKILRPKEKEMFDNEIAPIMEHIFNNLGISSEASSSQK